VSGASFIGESATALDAVLLRLKRDEEARRRATRRFAAAAAVAVMHVAIVIALLRVDWLPAQQRQRRAESPPLLWLILNKPAGEQQVEQKQKEKKELKNAPVTVVLPIVRPPQPIQNFDAAQALGEALACGASSYEYLTQDARAKCKRQPWHFKYDKDGYIVLDTEAKAPAVAEAQHETGAEAQQRMMNTSDPCQAARITGTPCIDKMIFGSGPH
jgi:hypothetical protein